MSEPRSLPRFSDLPLRRDDPPYSAWGLYGEDDQLGALNRLPDELVRKNAREEIQSGIRFITIFADIDFMTLGTAEYH